MLRKSTFCRSPPSPSGNHSLPPEFWPFFTWFPPPPYLLDVINVRHLIEQNFLAQNFSITKFYGWLLYFFSNLFELYICYAILPYLCWNLPVSIIYSFLISRISDSHTEFVTNTSEVNNNYLKHYLIILYRQFVFEFCVFVSCSNLSLCKIRSISFFTNTVPEI